MKKARRLIDFGKVFIVISANILVIFSLGSMAKADDFPTKPITLTVTMSAGGATDQTMRAITPVMEKVLKTSIVIQYKTGGGGTVGWSWLSRQDPDGYTLGTYSNSLIQQQYTKIGGVKIDKFDFVGNVIFTDGSLSARNDSPFKNFKELLDYAKKNPEVVTLSNSGTGAIWHLLAAGVENRAGVKFTHVPMTGESTATLAMLGGHVTVAAVSIGQVGTYVKAGKARLFGVASETRCPAFPDVPTFKEQGIDFQYGGLVGILGPKGIPENRLQILSNALEKGFQAAQFQELMRTLGHRTMFHDYKELPQVIKIEDAKVYELLKLVGLLGK